MARKYEKVQELLPVIKVRLAEGKTQREIAEEFGGSIPVSLMGQYVPLGKAADYPDINRKITAREYNKVLDYLYEAGLDGFVQELSSAKKDYVPDFDPDKLP